MSLIKIMMPGSQTFDTKQTDLVKVSSRGLVGDDLKTFVKRAGHEFLGKLRDIDVKPGEQLVHLIALGATEKYGPNRNGDGFKSAACRKYHPTFVKNARFYRNHLNKDKEKSYGIIKLSAFNEAMSRIELLVALNATKEAADRNKGLIADDEMQKLASDQEIAVSMAATVPYDVCSGCGNKAPSRAQYCTARTCKYGGCKENLTKVAEDGHVLHVDNPEPTWFDISNVGRPADRIAHVFGHIKAASHEKMGGCAIAESIGVTAPYHIMHDMFDDRTYELVKLANDLAELESDLESGRMGYSIKDEVILDDKKASLYDIPAGRLTSTQIWRALSLEKVALSVKDWLDVINNENTSVITKFASAEEVEACLPGVFGRLASDPTSLQACLTDSPCDPSLAFPCERVKSWAYKTACDKSISTNMFERRLTRKLVSGMEKAASFKSFNKVASSESEQLARRYAAYQLYFLNEFKNDSNYGWYKEHAVRSNYLA